MDINELQRSFYNEPRLYDVAWKELKEGLSPELLRGALPIFCKDVGKLVLAYQPPNDQILMRLAAETNCIQQLCNRLHTLMGYSHLQMCGTDATANISLVNGAIRASILRQVP